VQIAPEHGTGSPCANCCSSAIETERKTALTFVRSRSGEWTCGYVAFSVAGNGAPSAGSATSVTMSVLDTGVVGGVCTVEVVDAVFALLLQPATTSNRSDASTPMTREEDFLMPESLPPRRAERRDTAGDFYDAGRHAVRSDA